MDRDFIPDPEWVMLGCTQPDGVVVFASKTIVGEADIRQALAHVLQPGTNKLLPAWEMSVVMEDVTWATGTDYGDAIRRLFEFWSPGSELLALPGVAAIGARSSREEGVGWAKSPRTLNP